MLYSHKIYNAPIKANYILQETRNRIISLLITVFMHTSRMLNYIFSLSFIRTTNQCNNNLSIETFHIHATPYTITFQNPICCDDREEMMTICVTQLNDLLYPIALCFLRMEFINFVTPQKSKERMAEHYIFSEKIIFFNGSCG